MEVLLHIGGEKFVMGISEAMGVCEVLNACNRLGKEWSSVHGTNVLMFTKPDIEASYITPITAHTRLEVESNQREIAQGKVK
jgi:hypothetical protein